MLIIKFIFIIEKKIMFMLYMTIISENLLGARNLLHGKALFSGFE